MRTAALLALLGCLWALSAQATVYRWVDADGTVHFSDQPHQGADEVQLQEVQTYSAPKPAPASGQPNTAASRPKQVNFRYTNCSITSPAPDSTLANVNSVAVHLSVEPGPRPGDHISLYFDGTLVAGSGGTATSYQISDVERGTHAVSASISDPGGGTLCQSGPVNFYVTQPSLLNPQNPNNAAPVKLPTLH